MSRGNLDVLKLLSPFDCVSQFLLSILINCNFRLSIEWNNFSGRVLLGKGPFKCYVTLFSWKFDPHPPPRNANNVGPYTFVTLFSGKFDPTPICVTQHLNGPEDRKTDMPSLEDTKRID